MSKLTDNLKLLIQACGIDGAMESLDEMIQSGAETIEDLTKHIADELFYMAKDAE